MSDRMSAQYRLMIYFAHSTMVLYSKTIVHNPEMTTEEFYKANEEVCTRVFDEGLNIFNYELSYHQVMAACQVYLSAIYHPQSVKEQKAYTLS